MAVSPFLSLYKYKHYFSKILLLLGSHFAESDKYIKTTYFQFKSYFARVEMVDHLYHTISQEK